MAMTKTAPDPVDIHVGSRVRLRRTLLGMSQEKLGNALGLTFQQVQKYERGTNRMGSSRIYHVSQILDVPISFFFDDLATLPSKNIGGEKVEANQFNKRETLELVRSYYKIEDPKVRKKLFEMTKVLGKAV